MNDDNMANEDQNGDEEINLPDADFSALEESVSMPGDIEKLKLESEEMKDKYIRALAEFENYKKRTIRERSDLLKYQGERVLLDMLEIIDNLELALQFAEADPVKLKEGLDLIYKRFKDVLAKWEVKGESAVDQEFDPAKHSAISKVAVEGKKPGIVINELKKAYFYKDKLLRPGEVVVAEEKKE